MMPQLENLQAAAKARREGPEPLQIVIAATTTYSARVIHRIEPTHGYQMHVLILVDVLASGTVKAVNPVDSTNYDSATIAAAGRVALSYIVKEGTDVHSVRIDIVAAPATVGYRMIITHQKVTEG